MKEYEDRREWDIGGYEIIRLHIDYRFGIQIWGSEGEATFEIEAPFSILSSGVEHLCDPEDKASLTPALFLHARPVKSIVAYRNGLLRINFNDGLSLSVPKRIDGFETWESFGSGELQDIGMLCSNHKGPPWKD
jgi:Family of unknown function (DUF6188)